MRIDMIQPQQIPNVPKISEGNSTSTNYDNEFNRQLQSYVSESGNEKNDAADKSFKDSLNKLGEKLKQNGKTIQFKILKNPNQIVTQIVDKDTGEVLDELPPEKLRAILDSISQNPGLTIDKKV